MAPLDMALLIQSFKPDVQNINVPRLFLNLRGSQCRNFRPGKILLFDQGKTCLDPPWNPF